MIGAGRRYVEVLESELGPRPMNSPAKTAPSQQSNSLHPARIVISSSTASPPFWMKRRTVTNPRHLYQEQQGISGNAVAPCRGYRQRPNLGHSTPAHALVPSSTHSTLIATLHTPAESTRACRINQRFHGRIRKLVVDQLEKDDELQRFFILVDTGLAIVAGMWRIRY